MTAPLTIREYLVELNAVLRARLGRRRRILVEVEDHLREAASAYMAHGVTEKEAELRATTAFGEPAVVADAFGADALARVTDGLLRVGGKLDVWLAQHLWAGATLAATTIASVYVVAAAAVTLSGVETDLVDLGMLPVPMTFLWWARMAWTLRNRPERGLWARARAADKEFLLVWPVQFFLGAVAATTYRDMAWGRPEPSTWNLNVRVFWAFLTVQLAGTVAVYGLPDLLRRWRALRGTGDGRWPDDHPWAGAFAAPSLGVCIAWLALVASDGRSSVTVRIVVAGLAVSFASLSVLYRGSLANRRSVLAVQHALVLESTWAPTTRAWEHRLQEERARDDVQGERVALSGLGRALCDQGRPEEAIRWYQELLDVCRAGDDRHWELQALVDLGTAYLASARLDDAAECFEQALATARHDPGERCLEALALLCLGNVSYTQGRWDDALALHDHSHALYRAVGDQTGEAHALRNRGLDLMCLGRWAESVESLRASRSLFEAAGDENCVDTATDLAWLLAGGERWDEAIRQYEDSVALARRLGSVATEARALAGLAYAYEAIDQQESADACWRQALVCYERLGDPEAEQIRSTRLRTL